MTEKRAPAMLAPLSEPVFRRIWTASLLSNLGLMIQGVGSAWAMTQMTGAADMVALVQTAAFTPMMLLSIPAGAIADMFDRRVVGMIALSIAIFGAGGLALLAILGLITPKLLLAFCFLVGAGMALFSPSWQASVSSQVAPEMLPSAIALNSISYNAARSVGPAIGGIIVAAASATGAFVINALFYLPLLLVLALWRPKVEVSRLPPERLFQAIRSGLRYVASAPVIRSMVLRSLLLGLTGASVPALMPLIARDLLMGNAFTYGLVLGSFGMGSVAGAVMVTSVRARIGVERAASISGPVMALAVAVVAVSPWLPLTMLALIVAGSAWIMKVSIYNIGIQLAAPRWVAGRALATFQTSIAGGLALGAWIWGRVAVYSGVSGALLLSAVSLLLVGLLNLRRPIREVRASPSAGVEIDLESIALALTDRSGPILIELEYRVGQENARRFYALMQQVYRVRRGNGAVGWQIARDISDPQIWVERFHCPTWLDYRQMQSRLTIADQALQRELQAFQIGDDSMRVRRYLERPFGSVRWSEQTPDRGADVQASMAEPPFL
jgi:MFS family permease